MKMSIKNKFLSLALALALALIWLRSPLAATEDDREVERVGKMVLAGIALNVVGIFGGWAVGDALSGPHMSDHIAPGSPMAALIGSALGSSLGVFLAGNTRIAPGKFGSALAGGFLGTAAAIVVTLPILGLESGVGILLGLVAVAVLPPLGSALCFNRSLKARALAKRGALFNFAGGRWGVGIPGIGFSPHYVPGTGSKPDWRFSARLVSLEL